MLDLTTITFDEANKIEIALICLENDIIRKAESYEELAAWDELSEQTRKDMKHNGEWWREVHALLFKTER